MRILIFCHSIASDWNNGNAHFLRGVANELLAGGHEVEVFEAADGWSAHNLAADHGRAALEGFRKHYPELHVNRYDPDTLDPHRVLEGADVVLVHEWNPPALVGRLGAAASAVGCRALFHDTHHRTVSEPREMAAYDLSQYDGVLAFGAVIRDLYLARGWAQRAWVWHEAADVRLFRPLSDVARSGDLVWIGNWGDEERSVELHEFLVAPIAALRLEARVHGVRYPEHAIAALRRAGIEYGGYLPNYDAPAVYARFRVTIHIPRRPYTRLLPGIPTIRVFEALACGIPLVCAPWDDVEGLFTEGKDYLVGKDGREMTRHLERLIDSPAEARQLAEHGRRTVLERHTCAHRAGELVAIARELGVSHASLEVAP